MFAFLTRKKAVGVAAGDEEAVRDVSANARRKRLFARTVMAPDVVTAAERQQAIRETFGSKPPGA